MHTEIVWCSVFDSDEIQKRVHLIAFVRTLQRAANKRHFKHQETNNHTKANVTANSVSVAISSTLLHT